MTVKPQIPLLLLCDMSFVSIHQTDIPHGARVLVRATLNVPIQEGEVASMFRLQKTAQTIEFLLRKGARVTVIGHLGRDGASLAPVHKALSKIIPISFIPHVVGDVPYAARKNMMPGDVILLENTRMDPREEKNDILFVEELAAQADIFVFDDFSAAHREHASTTGLISALPSYAGILFYEEIAALHRLTDRLETPAVAIVSGAKCETKIPLIEGLLKTYDTIFVGGVLANTIMKQRGYSVGSSKVDDVPVSKEILTNKKIVFPQEVLVTTDFFDVATKPFGEIESEDIIVDVGDKALLAMRYYFENAKTIFMNGPLGWCEKGFCAQTVTLSGLVSKSQAYSVVGGGETVAVLEQENMFNDWKFVSTGGGSFLTYLAKETLPVIEAFKKKLQQKDRADVWSGVFHHRG